MGDERARRAFADACAGQVTLGACDRIGQLFGPLTTLLILTAQLRDEVAAMRWSEIDLKRRKWMNPTRGSQE